MSFGAKDLLRYAGDVFGTEPEYLWARLPEAYVLRHETGGKWYAIGMPVRRDRLGLVGAEPVDILNVKCGKLLLGSLLGRPGFLPAYHMSKTQWVSILQDGTVPEEEIKDLLNISYDLTGRMRKVPKRRTTEKEEKQ